MKLALIATALLLVSCSGESVTNSTTEPANTVTSSPTVDSPSSEEISESDVEQDSFSPEPVSSPIAQNSQDLPQWGSYENCIDALQANLIKESSMVDVEIYEIKRSVYLPPDEGTVAEVRHFGEFRLKDDNSVRTYLDAYCAIYEPGSVDVGFPTPNGQWAWIKIDESGYNATSEVGDPPFEGWTNF